MTSCLTKSSEKSKNSLIRGGVINPIFQNLKIFLNKGGVIYPGVFIFRSSVTSRKIFTAPTARMNKVNEMTTSQKRGWKVNVMKQSLLRVSVESNSYSQRLFHVTSPVIAKNFPWSLRHCRISQFRSQVSSFFCRHALL